MFQDVIVEFDYPNGKSAPKGASNGYVCQTNCCILTGRGKEAEKKGIAFGSVKHTGGKQNLTIARNYALHKAINNSGLSLEEKTQIWEERAIRRCPIV